MAMMISHRLPWPLRQYLNSEVLPPSSVPLTLHLWCFSSFCSPYSLQSSLSHAHLLNQGVSFLGQKPERKSGNISWLVLQDQQSITVPTKPNQITKSLNSPNLPPQIPRMIKEQHFSTTLSLRRISICSCLWQSHFFCAQQAFQLILLNIFFQQWHHYQTSGIAKRDCMETEPCREAIGRGVHGHTQVLGYELVRVL